MNGLEGGTKIRTMLTSLNQVAEQSVEKMQIAITCSEQSREFTEHVKTSIETMKQNIQQIDQVNKKIAEQAENQSVLTEQVLHNEPYHRVKNLQAVTPQGALVD